MMFADAHIGQPVRLSDGCWYTKTGEMFARVAGGHTHLPKGKVVLVKAHRRVYGLEGEG